jgi:processive rubber oxygenase RoxA-like protein
MRLLSRIGVAVLILFGISAGARAQAPGSGGSPTYLDQGWTEAQRQQFYTTSQGSQLIPLAWFLALERPASEELFTIDQMSRFGFLPNPQSAMNPNGFPVGFVEDPNDGGWAGLTCSACHTGQVEYHGATLRIDGGPSNADVLAFVTELNASLQSTLADSAKFARFASKVAGSDLRRQHDLRNQLTRFAAYFSTFLDTSTPDSPWGPARVDAFGMIFNRASSIDLSDATLWSWFDPLESNAQKPNAPVSYPFLWGTSRQDHVQWNAVARNKLKYERLGRNIGEAIGVFARVNIRKPTALEHGYASSVNIPNQLMIEETLIHSLKSPQWPAATLGEIDQAKASQGAALYKKYCVSCHILVDRNDTSPITVKQIPIGDVATDPTMAMNVACRMADTGILVGTKQPPVLGHELKPQDYTVNLVANEGVGVLEGWLEGSSERASVSASASAKPSLFHSRTQSGAAAAPASGQAQPPASASAKPAVQLAPAPVPFEPSTGSPGNCTGAAKVYKAAPLGGIWATAPYLHNGSVASLYQLLLPASERLSTFKVGSRQFDPQNVGFDAAAGSFDFDTSVVGNSNKGHEYGKQLTDAERWQLVEFLKTL